MKLATFLPAELPASPPRIGALDRSAQHLVDLQAVATARDARPHESLQDMLALLGAGQDGMQLARGLLEFAERSGQSDWQFPLSSVRLLAPVPVPRSLRDCMVFEQHLVQASRRIIGRRFPPLAWFDALWQRLSGRSLLVPRVWYERPVYYKGNVHSVVGHDWPVRWPSYSQRLDFELEIGIFVGRRGRDIPVDRASEYIAGYTVFNDFSARDVQLREMQARLGPAKGKDFDTGNVLGPYLVTPDEIPDPYNLRMTARVNGATWGEGNSGRMRHRFEEIIAYVSRDETILPGDFIAAGTVGNGCGLEQNRWLAPGDVVELEIECLGVLRNQVVQT